MTAARPYDARARLLGGAQMGLILSVLLVPRMAALTAFLPALVMLAVTPSVLRPLERAAWPTLLMAALLFGIYLLASVAWTPSRSEGLAKAAIYIGLVAAIWVVHDALRRQSDAVVRAIAFGTVAAAAVGLVILAFEEVSGHLLRRALYAAVPMVRPPEKHVQVSNGDFEAFGAYLTNRNMAVISLLLWPALGVLAAIVPGRTAIPASAAALALAALAVVNSMHDTSMLALLAGCVVFALARLLPRLALPIVATGWLVATLLVVPLAKYAYDEGLHLSAGIPESGRQRIVLWGYTAEQVPKRPLFGVGIAATKVLDERHAAPEKPPGFPYARRTGPHAHNIYLQTWYELGAAGAALLAALGLGLLDAVRRSPAGALPHVLAAFASAGVIAGFTWGMWQAWFMGAFALSTMVCLLALEGARRRDANGARD